MRFAAFTLALLHLLLPVAESTAQGLTSPQYGAGVPWPEEARGRGLPRPAWMLVVPAHREDDGTLSIWDRRDEWTAAWLVPKTVDGLRLVTLRGDTEDARTITGTAIDQMEISPMDRILRKYGAPAVALAVRDSHGVSVAVYVPGWRASWMPVEATSDNVVAVRQETLETIAFMTGDGTSGPGTPSYEPRVDYRVAVEAWRPAADGLGSDFLVTAADPVVVDLLGSVSGVTGIAVREADATGTRAEVAFSGDPDEFTAALRAAGLTVD